MRILSITTSLSEDSTTLKLSNKIIAAATSAADAADLSAETEHINVRNLSSDLTDMALTGFRSDNLEAAFAQVAAADVIVTVAPRYKVAPVGLHTLFWQLIDEKALANKPVLIGSTGGTPRHSLAGRPCCVRCCPTSRASSYRRRSSPPPMTGAASKAGAASTPESLRPARS